MKAMASVIRLSDNPKVFWQKVNGILNCGFTDLFENNDLEILDPPSTRIKYYNSWRLAVLPKDNLPKGFSIVQTLCPDKFSFTDPNGRNIDLEYHRIPEKIKKEYSIIFKSLKPIKSLRKEIENFSSFFDEKTVSVHIRSWDDYEIRRELYDIESFKEEMNKHPEESNFFLAADSQEVVEQLRECYGDRILTYARKSDLSSSRSNVQGMRDDLVELYLLSKNNSIIGTHMSTFTEVAWWLGACKAEVTIALKNKI